MRSDRIGARSARRVAIILIAFGLQGCMPLMKPPPLWGLDELSNSFPPGVSGRDLDKALVSRGFAIANDLAPPHHDAYFRFEGILVVCVAHLLWDEDQSGKIASNLKITYPCASL